MKTACCRRLLIGAAGIALLAGCGKKPPAAQAPDRPPSGPPVADFVVCIDNSRSIRPAEQVLIREVTMLLADLAEENDRIAAVTFGQGARIVASQQIRGDADRVAFKREVAARVDFREGLSDIRAGIRVLAENQGALFRPSGSVRAPILLSDGKLEPGDHKTKEAFDELRRDRNGPLAQTDIYAVVLGDTYSKDEVLPQMNGVSLMRDHVARSDDYFFHARSLDQLLEIAVSILNRTKRISSLGEPGAATFKIDHAVDSMTLIVRKRSAAAPDAPPLRSADIRLKWPGGEPITLNNAAKHASGSSSVYWAGDYQYFDLIVVRKPQEGMWGIETAGGRAPEVLAKIASHVELQFAARSHYYRNEASAITAQLFDKKTGKISARPYKVEARLSVEGNNVDTPLEPAAEAGRYWLEAPAGLARSLGLEGKAAKVTLELTAQECKTPECREFDPWFIRRSGRIPVELVEPFTRWTVPDSRWRWVPFWKRQMALAAEILDPPKGDRRYPEFEVAPAVSVRIEQLDDDSNSYKLLQEGALAKASDRPVYRLARPVPSWGEYRYAYRLSGATRTQGPFALQSPWYPVEVRIPWWEILVILFVLVWFVSWLTTQMTGMVKVFAPGSRAPKHTIPVNPARRFANPNMPGVDLTAKRFCFLRPRVVLKVSNGAVQVNNKPVGPGQKVSLKANRTHTVKCGQGAQAVSLEMNLNV